MGFPDPSPINESLRARVRRGMSARGDEDETSRPTSWEIRGYSSLRKTTIECNEVEGKRRDAEAGAIQTRPVLYLRQRKTPEIYLHYPLLPSQSFHPANPLRMANPFEPSSPSPLNLTSTTSPLHPQTRTSSLSTSPSPKSTPSQSPNPPTQ